MRLDTAERDISKLCSRYWLSDVGRLRQVVSTLPLAAADVGVIFERVKDHAQRGQKGRAANWLAVALLFNQAKTLKLLKRDGVLRASKYQFNPTTPQFLVEELLKRGDHLALPLETQSFLSSALELLTFAAAAHKEFRGLIALLNSEPYTLARSCLITLDLLFLRDAFSDLDFHLPWHPEPYMGAPLRK
jgi:hypothetical protein